MSTRTRVARNGSTIESFAERTWRKCSWWPSHQDCEKKERREAGGRMREDGGKKSLSDENDGKMSQQTPPTDDVTRVKPFAIRNAEATDREKKKEKQKAREVDASAFPTFAAGGAAGGVAP